MHGLSGKTRRPNSVSIVLPARTGETDSAFLLNYYMIKQSILLLISIVFKLKKLLQIGKMASLQPLIWHGLYPYSMNRQM